MGIELSDETVAMIEKQMQTGRFGSVDELLQAALVRVSATENFELTEEEMQESLRLIEQAAEDREAGRTISYEEWRVHMEEKKRKLLG